MFSRKRSRSTTVYRQFQKREREFGSQRKRSVGAILSTDNTFLRGTSTANCTMSGYTVIITLLVTVAISAIFWKLAPKENQTVWRSTVCLTLAMVYLMWAITYLAQLHPLVQPRRSDLRPEFAD